MNQSLSLKKLVRIAVLSALSCVLSFIRIYQLPQGGNVSLGMIPILLAFVYLDKPSAILTAVLSGILQYLPDPYFINLFQWLLDYPIAWGALALPVILPSKLNRIAKIILGGIIGGAGRFVFHFIGGKLYFAMFAPEGMNPNIYVAGYILSHLIPSIIITIIAVLILNRLKIGEALARN